MDWTKPVIRLAHGAWHEPELYVPLKNALGTRGYELLVPRLATMGEGKTGTSRDADVEMLIDVAAPFFDLGRTSFSRLTRMMGSQRPYQHRITASTRDV